MNSQASKIEIATPVGDRVLIRRDKAKKMTKAGIHLPENTVIPTLLGRIIAISPKVENNPDYSDLKKYQRVLFNPHRQIPLDFEERDNPVVVVPVDDIVAVMSQPTPCDDPATAPAEV